MVDKRREFFVAALSLDYYILARRNERLKKWLAASLGLVVGGLSYLTASPFFK